MKIMDKTASVTVILTLLVLTGFFMISNKSYAMPEKVPEITSLWLVLFSY